MTEQLQVLYAEDDPLDVELTRLHFARYAPDMALEIVQRGEDFIACARQRRHDVAILDQKLPDMDGIEVLRLFMRENLDLPLIMVTGSGNDDLAAQAIQLGAEDYLPKREDYLSLLPGLLREVAERCQMRPPGERGHGRPRRRILVVEDSLADYQILRRYLAVHSPQSTLERADTASRALDRLESGEKYDLIVCDQNLPGMSGLELLQTVRRRGRRAPFILLTGGGSENVAVAALKLGASDYLTKDGRDSGELALRFELAIERHELVLARERAVQELEARQLALTKLASTTDELRILSRRLLEVREEECRRLARELHDEIGQTLTAAKMCIDAAVNSVGASGSSLNSYAQVSTMIDRLLGQVRSLTLDLRPPMLDDFGLLHALSWLLQNRAQAEGGLSTHLHADPGLGRLDSGIETACYRVAQEAVTNVCRHASAHTLVLTLVREAAALRLTVDDDGKGFEPEAALSHAEQGRSLGLLSMRERAALVGGTVTVRSGPGEGTEVEAFFPLAATSPAGQRARSV